MKLIDANGRLFGKVSLLDIGIILALVIFLAGFIYNRTSQDIRRIIAPDTPMQITFLVEGVRDFSFDAISEGDIFFRQHERTIPLGTVVNIERRPNYQLATRVDGTAALVLSEARYNMHITIEGTGSVTERGFFLNGTQQMSEGGTMTIQSNRMFTTAVVYNVVVG